ncbi:MAG: response regulator [Bdellovibrio sp.]
MSKEKVLIVDDDEDLCKLISLYFSMDGYNSITAADGFQAMELIQTENPDIVISDILMPNCDGFCLIEEMNKKLAQPPPIIFISGYVGSTGDLNRLSQYPNFINYFTKPFKSQTLVNEVKNYFKKNDQLNLKI